MTDRHTDKTMYKIRCAYVIGIFIKNSRYLSLTAKTITFTLYHYRLTDRRTDKVDYRVATVLITILSFVNKYIIFFVHTIEII